MGEKHGEVVEGERQEVLEVIKVQATGLEEVLEASKGTTAVEVPIPGTVAAGYSVGTDYTLRRMQMKMAAEVEVIGAVVVDAVAVGDAAVVVVAPAEMMRSLAEAEETAGQEYEAVGYIHLSHSFLGKRTVEGEVVSDDRLVDIEMPREDRRAGGMMAPVDMKPVHHSGRNGVDSPKPDLGGHISL